MQSSRREITDGAIEIDIDHPSVANQIVEIGKAKFEEKRQIIAGPQEAANSTAGSGKGCC
jgi:hypothetical protein